jgi:WD40 repeat protein
MNNNLTTTNQNSKLALTKSKNLLNIANSLLSKKSSSDLSKVFPFKPFLLQKGHTDSVNSVAISPDGKFIVSGSSDDTIKIWDFKTGECLNNLDGNLYSITSVAISPDGKYIVSGEGNLSYSEGIVTIWDFKTGECLKTLEGHENSVNSVAITPDGKYIVSGDNYSFGEEKGGTIKIWDLKTGECLNTLDGCCRSVYSLTISTDGKYIVSGHDYGFIGIDNIKTGEALYLGGYYSCTLLNISLNEESIIAQNWHCNIEKTFDLKTGECLNTQKIWGESMLEQIVISHDEKYKVSISDDEMIRVWDFKTGDLIQIIDYDLEIAIDKNGYFIANDENIEKYIRISERPLTQRKLTPEEINHFRKKAKDIVIETNKSYDYEDFDNDEIPF